MRETWDRSLGREDLLAKEMATHSSSLAWKISWTEEPGKLQSMGSLRVGHDWATSLSLFTFVHWRRKWQCSCLEDPRDRGAWCAAVYGVAQSRRRLKRLSSSSSNLVINVIVVTFQFHPVSIFFPLFPNILGGYSCVTFYNNLWFYFKCIYLLCKTLGLLLNTS